MVAVRPLAAVGERQLQGSLGLRRRYVWQTVLHPFHRRRASLGTFPRHERVRIHFAYRLRFSVRASDTLASVVGEGAKDIFERGVHGLARGLQSAPLYSDGSGQVGSHGQPPPQAISSSRAQIDWAGNSGVLGRDEAQTFNGSSPNAQGRCSYWGIQRARPVLFQRVRRPQRDARTYVSTHHVPMERPSRPCCAQCVAPHRLLTARRGLLRLAASGQFT